MSPGFFNRFFSFRNYLLFSVAGIFILTFFAKQYAFFPFDLYITREIQLIRIPLFEELMVLISWLGNFYPVVGSLILAGGFLYYISRKDLALGLLGSSFGAVAISETLKVIVSRPRPDSSLIHQIEKFSRDDSFPSGHVLYYTGFYGFLLFAIFVLVKNKKWRNILSGILLSMIILVGVSRIYRGSHWFSDTLASYLIGSIWLYLVVFVYHRLVKTKKVNPEELKLPEKN
jgi:membrane-associated phospholipid phosphatase